MLKVRPWVVLVKGLFPVKSVNPPNCRRNNNLMFYNTQQNEKEYTK